MGKEKTERVYVNQDRCKACGYCIEACPKQAISFSEYVNPKGYNAVQVDEEKCIACGTCYRVCPDYVYEIR